MLIYFLILSGALFSIGFTITVIKKNAVVVLMGIELMLNAVNLNFIAFSRFDPDKLQGHIFTLFVIMVAAAEAAVGLAIILKLYSHIKSADLSDAQTFKG